MASGVYASAAAILIVAVLAVAYGTSAPTLGVAEFAPAAQNQVEPPPTTAGDSERSARGGAHRSTTTTAPPTATATTVDPATGGAAAAPTTRTARTRACVGNPPRQTEDPMSPACLAAIFEGDNGGATATGVSATEIRVAIPNNAGTATDAGAQAIRALFDYFNQRYELYGRRLVPVFVAGGSSDPAASRAKAAEIAALDVFATVTGANEWNYNVSPTMVGALAQAGVISVSWGATSWLSDRTVFDALHPYAWSVYPSAEVSEANIGDFACRSLAHHPAAFAGEAAYKQRERRFAIVSAAVVPPNINPLVERLTDCTGVAPLTVSWASSSGTPALQTGLERLRSGDQGATTVICVCTSEQYSVVSTASTIGFKPEWILTPHINAAGNGENLVQSFYRSMAGFVPPIWFSAGPRLLPVQSRPFFGALASTGLLTTSSSVYNALGMAEFLYPELMLLASGVQAAGPALSAGTFAAGLMATQFPNPGAGQAPYYQPSAGFGPGDHSLYDDYSVAWWSDTAPALDPISSRPTGSWCYLGQGARYTVGTYPADGYQLLFNPDVPCR